MALQGWCKAEVLDAWSLPGSAFFLVGLHWELPSIKDNHRDDASSSQYLHPAHAIAHKPANTATRPPLMNQSSLHLKTLLVAPWLACQCECPRTAHSCSSMQLCEANHMHPRRLAAPCICTKYFSRHTRNHTRPLLADLHVISAGWGHLVSYILDRMIFCSRELSIAVGQWCDTSLVDQGAVSAAYFLTCTSCVVMLLSSGNRPCIPIEPLQALRRHTSHTIVKTQMEYNAP